MAGLPPRRKWLREGWTAGFAADAGGTVAIEFAFVLVLFLSILFGIIAFGFQFATRIALSYAVAEGGRAAVVELNPQARQSRAQQTVLAVIQNFAPLLDSARATVTVSPPASVPQLGNEIVISVTYADNRFNVFPFLPALGANSAVQSTFFAADPSG